MHDIIVIGSGWAGFTAAREAASLGKDVLLIENSLLGGTCLNAGCIPTKILVQSARLAAKVRRAADLGVSVQNPSVDLSAVVQRKRRIVASLRKGMETRIPSVKRLQGAAQLIAPGKVSCAGRTIEGASVILCTGSVPKALPGFPFDGRKVISSDEALELERVPDSLLVIGGGFIGCEFASVFNALGSRVTVLEVLPNILPGTDKDISRKLEAAFRRRGITVLTGADPSTIDRSQFETILVAVGRAPCTAGAEHAGVTVENGRIHVDERLRTSLEGVYAAGDCTGRLMLAHFAALQGRLAARNAAGVTAFMPSIAIPSVIFTSPEIACVGLTEDEAMKRGITVKEYQFDFLGSGMAHVMGETEGMLKILADSRTGTVVGAFVIGPGAAELGGTLTLAVQQGLTAQQLKESVFAHPSLSESISDMLH